MATVAEDLLAEDLLLARSEDRERVLGPLASQQPAHDLRVDDRAPPRDRPDGLDEGIDVGDPLLEQ